jgi:hypothetical protein
MHRLIDHLSAEEYWFNGTFATPDTSGNPKPLAVTGTFLNDGGHLLLEGTYRFAAGNTSHPFSVRVVSHLAHAVAIEVNSSHVGTLSGHIYSLGPGYELLATAPTSCAVGAHIELLSDQGLRATGVIAFTGGSLAFVANGSPGEDREGLGNVVGIFGGRRA